MGGVLIDQHQIVALLAEQIAVPVLTEQGHGGKAPGGRPVGNDSIRGMLLRSILRRILT